MRAIRVFLLAWILAGYIWFSFINTASAREVAGLALDSFDSRPARTILFIGNSRTYPFGMPYMVRAMADSAGAAEKYQIRVHGLPGRSLEQHWNNPEVRELLSAHWDDVVIQEMSGGHYPDRAASFQLYGERLVEAAKAVGARPVLFVGWTYGPQVWEQSPPGAQERYHRAIQDDHLRLARRTGALRANLGHVWRIARTRDLPFRLDIDGNHATRHGTYLNALIIYARLSGGDVTKVTYAPDGVPPENAALLRQLVAEALSTSS